MIFLPKNQGKAVYINILKNGLLRFGKKFDLTKGVYCQIMFLQCTISVDQLK